MVNVQQKAHNAPEISSPIDTQGSLTANRETQEAGSVGQHREQRCRTWRRTAALPIFPWKSTWIRGCPRIAAALGFWRATLPRRGRSGLPVVAVTLLHRQGYFCQRLDPSGWQVEEPAYWAVDEFVEELPHAALTN